MQGEALRVIDADIEAASMEVDAGHVGILEALYLYSRSLHSLTEYSRSVH